jgi:drug/metabolite transporter (DMT)-like permease
MQRQVWLGTLLLAASAAAYSSAGFFTRVVSTDSWTMLFWRGLFAGLFLGAMVVWRDWGRVREAVRDVGVTGLLVALSSAVATVFFLNAFRHATVAEVLMIGAIVPFVTAGLALLLIGERADRITLTASLVALAGVAVIARPAAAQGHLLGDLLAFGMTVFMALVVVLIRMKRGVSMLPAVCLSAFLCAAIVAPFAKPFSVDLRDLGLLALFGVSQFGLGLLLLSLGTPLVTATRGVLIGLLQTPLGILWVWLALSEAPTATTLAGGAIVLAAVVGDIVMPRHAHRAVTQPG